MTWMCIIHIWVVFEHKSAHKNKLAHENISFSNFLITTKFYWWRQENLPNHLPSAKTATLCVTLRHRSLCMHAIWHNFSFYDSCQHSCKINWACNQAYQHCSGHPNRTHWTSLSFCWGQMLKPFSPCRTFARQCCLRWGNHTVDSMWWLSVQYS